MHQILGTMEEWEGQTVDHSISYFNDAADFLYISFSLSQRIETFSKVFPQTFLWFKKATSL